MEPVTLITAAILSQFQSKELIGSLIGGIIGNRADALLCKSTNSLYERIKDQINEPANHDIKKAVRSSYLKATLLAVNHTRSKYKFWDDFHSNNPGDLREIERYIRKELILLKKPKVRFPKSDFDVSYQHLLKPKGGAANEMLPGMILRLKESVFKELERNRRRIEISLRDNILNGWVDNGNQVDWYKLTCAFFTEELKADDHRLATIIQTNYLDDISEKVDELHISSKDILRKLEPIFKEYKSIMPKVDHILTVVERTEKKLDDLHEKVDKLLENRAPDTRLPDFTVPGRHQKLTNDIENYTKEQLEIREQIEDLKAELKESDGEKRRRNQRMLERAESQWLHISQQKNEAEKELESFIANVLRLAEMFSKDQAADTPRLEKARALFYEGEYEEVDKVLNEDEIYEDIKALKEKRNDLAQELMVKAQAIIINKHLGWFEAANKYYKDAVDIHPSYDSCFALAYFLSEHRQINEAYLYYETTLKYVKDEVQRATILNNLGNLQSDKNEFDKAEKSYQEALDIR